MDNRLECHCFEVISPDAKDVACPVLCHRELVAVFLCLGYRHIGDRHEAALQLGPGPETDYLPAISDVVILVLHQWLNSVVKLKLVILANRGGLDTHELPGVCNELDLALISDYQLSF